MAPVYNLDNIDQIDNSNFQLVISDSIFLEMLLLNIRGNTIKFSSNLARSRRQEEVNLTQEIERLENSETIGSETALEEKKKGTGKVKRKRNSRVSNKVSGTKSSTL